MLRDQKGYTIIEVIVAIQIFTLIITMLYTVYLYGYKFYLRWDENSDLLRTELQVKKLFLTELQNACEIVEISDNGIVYISDDYMQKQIHWVSDSLYYNQHLVNKSGIKFNLTDMVFIYTKDDEVISASFQSADKNKDKKLSPEELYGLRKMRFTVNLNGRRFNKQSILIVNFSKIEDKFIVK